MKIKIALFLAAFILLVPNNSNAQAGLLRRAINRQIDRKIDSAAMKKAQEENNKSENNKEGEQPKSRTIGLLGGKTDIKHEDEYSFTGMIYSQTETYDRNEVRKSDFYTYFNPSSLNAGMEVKIVDPKKGESSLPTAFIFDMNNRCFMMLINGTDSKSGIISQIPDDSTMAAQAKAGRGNEGEKATVTKTGNSRVIAGYKCDEYRIVEPDKDGYANVWMTKDLKLKTDKRNWGKTGMPSYYGYPGFEGMTMLAMESFDKKGNPTMKMETKEINENYPHKISTDGYTFIKMNFGQAGSKK